MHYVCSANTKVEVSVGPLHNGCLCYSKVLHIPYTFSMSPLQITLVRSAEDRFMELRIMMGLKNAEENDIAQNDLYFGRSHFLLFMPPHVPPEAVIWIWPGQLPFQPLL